MINPGAIARYLAPAERIALALWVGSMWTVGFLVAPVLFKTLDSKAMAGQLAGRLFGYVSILGLIFGLVLLILLMLQDGVLAVRSWRAWALVLMVVITGIGQFMILPQMDALKRAGGGGIPATGEIAARFGALHAVSTVLFVINGLLGLVLVAGGVSRAG